MSLPQANGSRCDEIVELVDLVPTIGELLHMQVPDKLEGSSFAPLVFNPSRPWKKAAFSVFGNKGQHHSVRTKQHRYTEWQYKGTLIKELYGLKSDPWETVNLADSSHNPALQSDLEKMLRSGWQAALPK
ncbi:MAG: DUF4976 domain-containing protein [Pirellulaceae bacterium]|nr:DUF4976 domain-containing protein [Pirellulaceae bacterium]